MANANQSSPNATVPYVVSYNQWFRLLGIAYAVFVLCLLALARDDSGQAVAVAVWDQHGWLGRTGLILGFVTVPGILLEMFLEKLVFGMGEIRRRNAFGRWQEYVYDEVSALEVFPGEIARIRF